MTELDCEIDYMKLSNRINRRFDKKTPFYKKVITFLIRRDLKFEVWFWLYLNGNPILKTLAIWRLNIKYDVHIGSKAKIDPSIYIHHTMSVIIGNCVIKKGVSIYQGVTLGSASSYNREQCYKKNINPYPTLEEDVTVCSNSCILGGITIGRGAVIAAGAVVVEDIPPFALVKGNPAYIEKIIEPGKHPFYKR